MENTGTLTEQARAVIIERAMSALMVELEVWKPHLLPGHVDERRELWDTIQVALETVAEEVWALWERETSDWPKGDQA